METREGSTTGRTERAFPLEQTAQSLNERYGLYMSEGQQRGLAAGLLAGAILASAVLVWTVGTAARRSSRW